MNGTQNFASFVDGVSRVSATKLNHAGASGPEKGEIPWRCYSGPDDLAAIVDCAGVAADAEVDHPGISGPEERMAVLTGPHDVSGVVHGFGRACAPERAEIDHA